MLRMEPRLFRVTIAKVTHDRQIADRCARIGIGNAPATLEVGAAADSPSIIPDTYDRKSVRYAVPACQA